MTNWIMPMFDVKPASNGAGVQLPISCELIAHAQALSLEVSPVGSAYAGTIGAICHKESVPMLLTCGHVLIDGVSAASGEVEIYCDGKRVAQRNRVFDSLPKCLGSSIPVDAGLIVIDSDEVTRIVKNIPGILPTGVRKDTLISGEALSLRGTNQQSIGRYVGPIPAVTLNIGSGRGSYSIERAHGYLVDPPSRGGDSGSAIWDSENRLVGLHCGEIENAEDSSFNAVFCHINDILAQFQVQLLTSNDASNTNGSNAPRVLSSITGGTGGANPSALGQKIGVASSDADILAKTIWAEAGEFGENAMRAVAAVVLNRLQAGQVGSPWLGKTIAEVCFKPYQFPCWNIGSPLNLKTIRNSSLNDGQKPTLAKAVEIAGEILARSLYTAPDELKGVTRYHPEWLQPRPIWAQGKTPAAKIAGLYFYNNVD